MSCPRRDFLASSAVLLGSKLLKVLTTPFHRWDSTPALQAATIPNLEKSSPVTFVDVADRAGLKVSNVWGGIDSKNYIIETKGTGIAFFDYDNDGSGWTFT